MHATSSGNQNFLSPSLLLWLKNNEPRFHMKQWKMLTSERQNFILKLTLLLYDEEKIKGCHITLLYVYQRYCPLFTTWALSTMPHLEPSADVEAYPSKTIISRLFFLTKQVTNCLNAKGCVLCSILEMFMPVGMVFVLGRPLGIINWLNETWWKWNIWNLWPRNRWCIMQGSQISRHIALQHFRWKTMDMISHRKQTKYRLI